MDISEIQRLIQEFYGFKPHEPSPLQFQAILDECPLDASWEYIDGAIRYYCHVPQKSKVQALPPPDLKNMIFQLRLEWNQIW